MERRSWLWRRKSLEKSHSGETESSGSVSSHSERFSDDQTVSIINNQSPEVTSKASPGDEQELNENLKTLSEKLSEALLNIRAKEELVNQHAKVAEEAVSGWERAENEVLSLKKQNDALTQQNLILEERVGHLDGALKECLRQLRLTREEQEEKIYETIVKKSNEWERKKSELENQLDDLQNQLQSAKTEASSPTLADALSRLESAEKENSILKLTLSSKAEDIKLLTNERDLSVRSAETASKQRLDSIKKVAKLEAECRRLKAVANKAAANNDYRSTAASSIYVESFTDSQSDNGERAFVIDNEACHVRLGECNPESGLIVSSIGIDLMDDFLEMERLAALPETGSNPQESPIRDDMEALTNRTAELEDELKNITEEKVNLENAFNECRIQLRDAEVSLMQIRDELAKAKEAKRTVETELEDANGRKEKAESKLKAMELQLEDLESSIHALKKEVERERNSRMEADEKCQNLESEMLRMKLDHDNQRSAMFNEFRVNQDKELAVAASKFADCQNTIASLGRQLKSLAAFEELVIDREGPEQSAGTAA